MRFSTLALFLASFTLLCAIVALPSIHAWEREAGYPFGRMCQSIFTGYANTCR